MHVSDAWQGGAKLLPAHCERAAPQEHLAKVLPPAYRRIVLLKFVSCYCSILCSTLYPACLPAAYPARKAMEGTDWEPMRDKIKGNNMLFGRNVKPFLQWKL